MAGRQTQIDFPQLEREARAAEAERAVELAARLRSIDPAAAGVTPLAWQRVSEVIMAAWSTTTTTSPPGSLTRDQHDRARRTAERLGLVRTTRRYQNGKRLSDAVDVDVGRIDALVALTRAGPNWSRTSHCAQVRPSAPNCAQLRPSAPNRCETAAPSSFLNLNLKPSSSSSLLDREEGRKNEEEEEEVEKFLEKVRRLLPAPLRLDEAVATALAAGVTLDELRARCRWFQQRQIEWKAEHRPGVLYVGLRDARPGQPADRGWPYRG